MADMLDDLPQILTPVEVATFLRIGRSRAYQLCHVQGFPAIRLGKTFRIPKAKLMAWLEAGGLERAEPTPRLRRR
jgi:excisionase family DNA binding protein